MKKYMAYIVENGATSLLYEKFINQNLSIAMMHAFSEQRIEPNLPASTIDSLTNAVERDNDILGINLAGKDNHPILHGSVQTTNKDLSDWLPDVPLLKILDNEINEERHPYGLDAQRIISGDKMHYYVDLTKKYIYFYTPMDSKKFIFRSWMMLEGRDIEMSPEAIKALENSDTVTTNIYLDHFSGVPIISLLSPVYSAGILRGIVAVDLNNQSLQRAFYTEDRPVLWKYLTLDITDNANKQIIVIHKSIANLYSYVIHRQPLSPEINACLSLDFTYFIVTSYKLFLPYILATLLLLYLVRVHFRRHTLLSKENITDSMTGLFNRKILSPELEVRLNNLVGRGIGITFIAMDCDGLKKINDTYGHKAGDKAIVTLAHALKGSLRKSDFAIRLGGDEFCAILINYNHGSILELIKRIKGRLVQLDDTGLVGFSWGSYDMRQNDTLEHAYHESDSQLYEDKKAKKKNAAPVKHS